MENPPKPPPEQSGRKYTPHFEPLSPSEKAHVLTQIREQIARGELKQPKDGGPAMNRRHSGKPAESAKKPERTLPALEVRQETVPTPLRLGGGAVLPKRDEDGKPLTYGHSTE